MADRKLVEIISSVEDHVDSTIHVEEAMEEVVDTCLWPAEDVQTLIENIVKVLPKQDTAKYSTTIKKINWDDVKFKQHSADSCKSQWDLVLSRIRRYRTLSEVLGDAREWVKNPYNSSSSTKKKRHPDMPKKPVTPFIRYFLEKRARCAKKNPQLTSVVDMAKALAAQYHELSEKKKAKYKAAYDREMEEWKEKMEQFKKDHPEIDLSPPNKKDSSQNIEGPVRPKTPFQLYCQAKSKTTEDGVSKKDNMENMRKKWHDLSDKKRLKWIRKALADEKRYHEELEEYKKNHPDFSPSATKVLNKSEKDLKQRFDGKPERPPTSGYGLYSRMMLKEIKDCPSKEKMSVIAKRWNELPASEKEQYNREVWESQLVYGKKLESYLKSLSQEERDQFLAEEKIKLPSEDRLKDRLDGLQGDKKTKEKQSPIKDAPLEQLAKDATISAAAQCYFQAERLSALQSKYPNKNTAELTGQIITDWSKMPLKEKEKYFRMVKGNIKLSQAKSSPAVKKTKQSISTEGLDDSELAILKALKKREPRKPPNNAYSIFLTDKLAQLSSIEPKKRMAEVSRLWKSVLSPEEKYRYEQKVKELLNAYEKEHAAFVKSLDENEKWLYEKFLKKPETVSTRKRAKNGNGAPAKKLKQSGDHDVKAIAESSAEEQSEDDNDESSESENDSDDENKAPTKEKPKPKKRDQESDDEEDEDEEEEDEDEEEEDCDDDEDSS